MSTVVYVEGNIGAGKSTVLNKLKLRHEDDNSLILTEPISNWPSLKLFYENKRRYAYQLQVEIMKSFHERETQCPDDARRQLYVFERSLRSAYEIFATLNCSPTELSSLDELYKRLSITNFYPFTRIVYIYIRTSVENCMQRISNRKQSIDSKIDIDYLRTLERAHDSIFLTEGAKVTDTNTYTVDGNQDESKLLADITAILMQIKQNNLSMF